MGNLKFQTYDLGGHAIGAFSSPFSCLFLYFPVLFFVFVLFFHFYISQIYRSLSCLTEAGAVQ